MKESIPCSPTTENTIKVLEKGFGDHGIPDEILTDYGTQFVAARNRKNQNILRKFLEENGVKHIVARINHSQTNEKIERWFGLLEQKNAFLQFHGGICKV